MANSELSVSSLGTPQHFLECGIQDCKKNCQFYCNPCHQQLCAQCKDQHLKNPQNNNHELVLYQQRKRQLPVEKCKMHPTNDIDFLCVDCKLPLCYKCSAHDHKWHDVVDLDIFYEDKMALCLEEFSKVDTYFLPISQNLHKEIKGDVTEINTIMHSLRANIKSEGESLKSMVDTVVSENMQKVDNIEKILLEKLQNDDTTLDNYISYLHDLVREFNDDLSSTKLTSIIPKLFDGFQEIRPIPETTKLATPVLTAGQYTKDDVVKLLSCVNVKDSNVEMRKIKPMDNISVSTTLEYISEQKKQRKHSTSTTIKQKKQDKQMENDVKQTMVPSSSFAKVREFTVDVKGTSQVSLDKSGKLWVGDHKGNLVQTDLQGNQLQSIKTSGGYGYHTVTPDGDVIFTDYNNKVVHKMTQNKKIKKFIKTGDWKPSSIHSSHINGNILVGMRNEGKAKVARYSKTGKELQNIQKTDRGQELYRNPYYITENINEDICVSDYYKKAVVVVNKLGQYRFSYKGQKSGFEPWGICTDALGHILVCDQTDVHLLNQQGQLLSLLRTSQHGLNVPISVCVDKENNIYVREYDTFKMTVYKHLQ